MGLRKLFEEAYAVWRKRDPDGLPVKGNETFDYFMGLRSRFQSVLINLGFPDLKVKAGVGVGRFAQVPWIGFRDPDITDNFEGGIFVVYVFAPDFGNLYLTLIQGVARLRSKQIEESTGELGEKIIKPDGFTVGIEVDLARNAPVDSNPDKYKRAALYAKKYMFKMLPEDDELERDLKNALAEYKNFARKQLQTDF